MIGASITSVIIMSDTSSSIGACVYFRNYGDVHIHWHIRFSLLSYLDHMHTGM